MGGWCGACREVLSTNGGLQAACLVLLGPSQGGLLLDNGFFDLDKVIEDIECLAIVIQICSSPPYRIGA
jgi:hypothetical protein